jgi:hypothetical protein
VGFFILNQYLLIKQIMLEPTEIKLFNKILSRLWNKYDGDVDLSDLAEELESLLGALVKILLSILETVIVS